MKPVRSYRLGPEIALLTVILFLVEFVRGAALLSFIPIYGKNTLHISLSIIGTAIAAHYLVDTFLKMGIGYLLDRWSSRLVINAGLLISLIGLALFIWGHHPMIFVLAAAIYGVGISPVWLVCLTKVQEEKRASQMGFLYTVWLVGMGAGPAVLNVILDHHPRGAYLLLLVLSGAAWLLSFMIKSSKHLSGEALKPAPFRKQWDALKGQLSAMKPMLPGMVLQTLGVGALVPILPTFANEQLSLTNTQYSLLLLVGGACTVIALIPMGKWSDKSGRKPFLYIGFAIFAVTLASLSLTPSIWITFGLAVVLGVSYAAVLPAWNALLALYVPPKQKGLGWSMLSTVEGIGVLVGPILGGVLADTLSVSTVIWISAGLFGIIAIVYMLFPSRWFAEH